MLIKKLVEASGLSLKKLISKRKLDMHGFLYLSFEGRCIVQALISLFMNQTRFLVFKFIYNWLIIGMGEGCCGIYIN